MSPENSPAGRADTPDAQPGQITPEQAAVFLRALYENAPDAVYFKDRQSRLTWVCRSMAKKRGIEDASALIGTTDFDSFSKEHAEKAFEDEQNIMRTGRPIYDMEEKETWPDGRVTWVSTSKMPLRDKSGKIVGTFGISRDITARVEAETLLKSTQKELLEASRLAGIAEISSGILHNIGNGLNSVNTSVTLLAGHFAHSQVANLAKAAEMLRENRSDLARFLTEDKRGAMLPDYLTDLSSLLAEEQAALREEVESLRSSVEHLKSIVALQQGYARTNILVDEADPLELIEEAIQISALSLKRHSIDVIREFTPVPPICVTRHKVLQILVNYIRNAKYALDDTGRNADKRITLILAPEPSGNVTITVRDNGIGVSAETMPNLFRFGFTTRKDGHGYGLHSCANTAREIGATVRAHSDGPGRGAAFTLELPPAPPENS
ncbi:MAG: PAS domain-containing protein [Opitutales bacterium]|nr:PAS domain-containing protein [Opitutales bacterium]